VSGFGAVGSPAREGRCIGMQDRTGRKILDWNDLRYFLAVARVHSLTEAARELRASQATIARRISALEEALSVVLFTRRHNGYSLTASGEALLPLAEKAETDLLWLERSAGFTADSEAGVVRLALPELLGQHVVIPSLSAFNKRYPRIHLEVLADVRPLNLAKREADLLVRLVHPAHGDYLVRRICGIKLGLYGSRAYVEARGLPLERSELDRHQFIGWEANLGYLPLSRWILDDVAASQIVFRSHTMSAQLAAVECGLGLAVLPVFIGKKFGLTRVLGPDDMFISDIWMLQAADARNYARVRAVADHVAEALTACAALMEGREEQEAGFSS